MAKLALLPFAHSAPVDAAADVHRRPRLRTRYYAFLSYSHQDKALADWLHCELERFRVPNTLSGKLTVNGVVPRRLLPVFRDEHDLSAGGELADEIKAALAASQFLIVLCSPTAAKSRWTNTEIESFKRTRPEGCVLAAIVAGEPFASDIRGREAEECFPPALRYKYDRRGKATNKRAEPLAADLRGGQEERRTGFLKLVSGMLGVGLDELVQRETTRRHRHMAWLAAASLAGMAVTSTLAVTAIHARDSARDQRREAEGLVAFMLGDLKDKLEPIGRLDALDGVGSKVLQYYGKQDPSQLSDAGLLQRSKALSLMAQVADSRGDVDTALPLYREAMRGTAEAITRTPSDPQPIFDHAQNVFYVGQIAQQRGDLATAEASMREYQRLARRMLALGPDSMKWRMETQYADTNLGVVLLGQRRFAEARAQFAEALRTIDAIATADPQNRDYKVSVAESLAWLGDAQRAVGDYRGATASRERQVALLERDAAQSGDVDFQQRLIAADRMLGIVYAEQGEADRATGQLRKAVAVADALIPKEPTNTLWLEYAFKAKLELARQLLLSGNRDEAALQTRAACQMVDGLLTRNGRKREWRVGHTRCWEMQAQLSLAAGANAQALQQAQRGLEAARKVDTGDATTDAFELARAYRLLGDVENANGQRDAARAAWTSAFAALPAARADLPNEMAERLTVLRRVGRTQDAQQLSSRLATIGFKDLDDRRA
jgi:tetratricopeptide (TPR) repeat protein